MACIPLRPLLSSTAMSDPIPYATADTRFRPGAWVALRRIAGYGALAILVVGLVLALDYCYSRPWIWYDSRDAYLRHEILNFEMPGRRVVYEEEPTRVARLLALPADRGVARLDVQATRPS